jgi:hypothetical protein
VFRDQPQAKSLRPYPAITKEQKGSKHWSSDRDKHVALRSKSLLYKDQKRKNDTACGAPYENHRWSWQSCCKCAAKGLLSRASCSSHALPAFCFKQSYRLHRSEEVYLTKSPLEF